MTTPPRGGRPATEFTLLGLPPRGGGVRPLNHRVHHEGHEQCLIFLRRSVHRIMVWTDRRTLGRRSIYWWIRLHECNRTLASLRAENRLLRTPAIPQVVHAPRQVAFMMTKVPRFDGTTSWEQYRQVFDAIVWSNGWDNDTAALQLFSHLEGDALNVVHLVPLSHRLSRTGLVDALAAHYGSPGRLADYRRLFERTTRTVGEDPAIFATALETLAVKAFGSMGQTARLRLIRDRFIAGHSSCELRRHLDSVPPETPIRDVVDRCHVWESHADPAVRRVGKPSPDPIYPAYVVGDADKISENTRVAADTRQKSGPDQLEDLLRRLLTVVDTPAVPAVEKLLERLVRETQSRPSPVVSPPEPAGLEQMYLET